MIVTISYYSHIFKHGLRGADWCAGCQQPVCVFVLWQAADPVIMHLQASETSASIKILVSAEYSVEDCILAVGEVVVRRQHEG